MFCPNCGTKNDDNVVFCKNCGTKINGVKQSESPAPTEAQPPVAPAEPVVDTPATPEVPVAPVAADIPETTAEPVAPVEPIVAAAVDTPAAPVAPVTPVYTPAAPAPAVSASAPRSKHPVLKVVKDMGASPLFLVAAITFSAAIFFSFIGLFTLSDSVSFLNKILNSAGIGGYDGALLYQYKGLTVGMGIIGLIPSVIYAIGIWSVFAAANNRRSDGMSTAGLTTIKVMEIIGLVFACIGLAAVLILAVVGFAGIRTLGGYIGNYGSNYSSVVSDVLPVVFVTLMIGVAIGLVLVIIYAAKIISSINTVKRTILTGNADYRVSGFVAVMNFIIAFFSLFSAFSGSFATLSTVCSIASLICFGILLFKYKSAMLKLIRPDANAYAQPYNANTYASAQNPYGGNPQA